MSRITTRILTLFISSFSLTRPALQQQPTRRILALTSRRPSRPLSDHRYYSWFSSTKTNSSSPSKSSTTGNSTSSTAIPASQLFNTENMTQQKSDEEWRAVLNPEQFRILRKKGTEMAYTGEYTKNKDQGVYRCAGCQTPLYTSGTKFDACGWCSFYDAIPGAVGRHVDADGHRIEIVCNACGGHLGHVFKGEGLGNPTDERHCVNSVSLKFQPGDN